MLFNISRFCCSVKDRYSKVNNLCCITIDKYCKVSNLCCITVYKYCKVSNLYGIPKQKCCKVSSLYDIKNKCCKARRLYCITIITSKSVDYTVLLETNAIKSTVYVMPVLKRTCNLTMSYSTAPVQEYMDAQITSQSFHQMFGAAPPSSSRLHAGTDVHRYSSYSGSSFSTSFDPDNVPVDRSPVYSGWVHCLDQLYELCFVLPICCMNCFVPSICCMNSVFVLMFVVLTPFCFPHLLC